MTIPTLTIAFFQAWHLLATSALPCTPLPHTQLLAPWAGYATIQLPGGTQSRTIQRYDVQEALVGTTRYTVSFMRLEDASGWQSDVRDVTFLIDGMPQHLLPSLTPARRPIPAYCTLRPIPVFTPFTPYALPPIHF